jgi:hypothetical protein
MEPLHGFILDAAAIFGVDLTACEVLAEFCEKLRSLSIRLVGVRAVMPPTRQVGCERVNLSGYNSLRNLLSAMVYPLIILRLFSASRDLFLCLLPVRDCRWLTHCLTR